jgi:putative ATP-dependent endonuclease of the OLD family
MSAGSPTTTSPIVRRLFIKRFRGIEKLSWCPEPGVNIILGGGDAGKSTILDALALLFSPNSTAAISDSDFWKREAEPDGFEIEAVMSLPDSSNVHNQSKQSWPWGWDGTTLSVPSIDDAGTVTVSGKPVFCVRVSANADFELSYEIVQPDGSADFLPVAVRRAIGLVRLGGDDRNDRDLRLVQGSALDRLLSDKSLRARLGFKLGESQVEEQLKQDAKDKLELLDAEFAKRALPNELGLGLTPGQGFSIGALIGLTASEGGIRLPLSNWGAGTRRLASLEIAAACQGADPITLVDEVERGLEPYRQRVLVERLQSGKSQVFMTTHSAVAISASVRSHIWYLDARGAIGHLPRDKIFRQQIRDPETFLSRLTIVAEGEAEKGFARTLLTRAGLSSLHDRGIWISDGQGNDASLSLLEALASGGLQFGGFVDNEGTAPTRWATLRTKLGPLLFQWSSGCIEDNIIKFVADDRLEALIADPDGDHTGDRLRTLADRLGIADRSFSAIKAKATDLRALIIETATGRIPADKANASDPEKKTLRSHQRCWFKSYKGGVELCQKIFDLAVWPRVKGQLLPFINAVRKTEKLPAITDLQ